ncbi:hypothetical protein KEM48_005473 [Puccinia striiformis f. sp. tritici PST-130]|nr:hypothetical protein KEM48_005473 [Puccinia striiformis f. sp. tritici PST-130]
MTWRHSVIQYRPLRTPGDVAEPPAGWPDQVVLQLCGLEAPLELGDLVVPIEADGLPEALAYEALSQAARP